VLLRQAEQEAPADREQQGEGQPPEHVQIIVGQMRKESMKRSGAPAGARNICDAGPGISSPANFHCASGAKDQILIDADGFHLRPISVAPPPRQIS
jgi:hypothetical protein